MNYITPFDSAVAAADIYRYRVGTDFSKELRVTNSNFDGQFRFGKDSRFKGQTGNGDVVSETGFGLVGQGIENRQDEALVIIRGTHITSKHDWLTNINTSMTKTVKGFDVHSGFYKTFDSFNQQIHDILDNQSIVHVIGHSLGGALATLTCDYLAKTGRTPILYSFGAPRVGTESYARYFTKLIKDENIFRVYNRQDPVSMVPTWPFMQHPMPGNGLSVGVHGITLNPYHHVMSRYVSLCETADWDTMRIKRDHNTVSDRMIENWLKSDQMASVNNSFVLFHSGINYVLTKVFKKTGVQDLSKFSDSVTAVDRMAFILSEAAKKFKEIKGLIKSLMVKILEDLGYPYDLNMNLTANFIRWVLDSMMKMIGYKVKIALSLPKQGA